MTTNKLLQMVQLVALGLMAGCGGQLDGDLLEESAADQVGTEEDATEIDPELEVSAASTASWTTIKPGIRYAAWTTAGPNRVYVAKIDLSQAHLFMHVTKEAERGRRTTAWAKSHNYELAINGDFHNPSRGYSVSGMAMANYTLWNNDRAKESFLAIAFVPRVGQVGVIQSHAETVTSTPPRLWAEAVGGHPMLVRDHANVAPSSCDICGINPRTAAGLSADRRTLILAVVDGRIKGSVGMTMRRLGTLMASQGADIALNLDGGGSSTMYIEGRGMVNHPADGVERIVGNHLGVDLTDR